MTCAFSHKYAKKQNIYTIYYNNVFINNANLFYGW